MYGAARWKSKRNSEIVQGGELCFLGVVDGAVRSLEFDSCGGFPDLLAAVERVFHKPDSDDVAFVHIIKKSLRLLVPFLNWL
jgi:hypothetical protein